MNRIVLGFALLGALALGVFAAVDAMRSPASSGHARAAKPHLTIRPAAKVEHPARPAVRDRVWRERDGVRLALDVDYPARIDRGGAPVVVLLHGGGWWSGNKAQLSEPGGLAHEFAAAGFVAVSADYGLACSTTSNPRELWGDDFTTDNDACGAYMTDQLADVGALVRWVHAHATDLGIDSRRVALFGISAGGQLALHAAFTAPATAQVAVVATWSGPPSTEFISKQPKVPTREVRSLRAPLANAIGCDRVACPAKWDAASPILQLRAQPEPHAVLDIAGEHETQVPFAEFERLHAQLDQLDVDNELLAGADTCHGESCGKRRLAGRDDAGIDATIEFLRLHMPRLSSAST